MSFRFVTEARVRGCAPDGIRHARSGTVNAMRSGDRLITRMWPQGAGAVATFPSVCSREISQRVASRFPLRLWA